MIYLLFDPPSSCALLASESETKKANTRERGLWEEINFTGDDLGELAIKEEDDGKQRKRVCTTKEKKRGG